MINIPLASGDATYAKSCVCRWQLANKESAQAITATSRRQVVADEHLCSWMSIRRPYMYMSMPIALLNWFLPEQLAQLEVQPSCAGRRFSATSGFLDSYDSCQCYADGQKGALLILTFMV